MVPVGHGINVGHGFVKYVVIDDVGTELVVNPFPAMIGRADKQVRGSLVNAQPTQCNGGWFWTGEDALLSPNPITRLAQERLVDQTFIPALLRGALDRMFLAYEGPPIGVAVTGLPATWAQDRSKAEQLGGLLRSATGRYSALRVIPEPLGLVYSALLDDSGDVVGDSALSRGSVAVVDLGHHTVDVCAIRGMVPMAASLETFQLGTARPLQRIRSNLIATYERELTLFEVDQVVRTGRLTVAGQPTEMTGDWDRPLIQNGEAIASRLVEAWGSGAQYDAILIGGGGAEVRQITAPILQRFHHAVVVDRPQTAIARGYARLARRIALEK